MNPHDRVAARFASTASLFLALVTAPWDERTQDLVERHEASGPFRLPIQSLLGDWDRYREVFDPSASEDDEQGAVVGTSISDDLSDVTHDLTAGLAELRAGRPREAIPGISEPMAGAPAPAALHACTASAADYSSRTGSRSAQLGPASTPTTRGTTSS